MSVWRALLECRSAQLVEAVSVSGERSALAPIVVIVSSTLGWPAIELAVLWLRFRHLPPNGPAEALVFAPMGFVAGLVAAILMIRASTSRQRRFVLWGYLVASPFAFVGACWAGSCCRECGGRWYPAQVRWQWVVSSGSWSDARRAREPPKGAHQADARALSLWPRPGAAQAQATRARLIKAPERRFRNALAGPNMG
jgi:hypothetical protein